jgi:hypothetical protein
MIMHVPRPAVPAESPTLGFTHLQFDAMLTAARDKKTAVPDDMAPRLVSCSQARVAGSSITRRI